MAEIIPISDVSELEVEDLKKLVVERVNKVYEKVSDEKIFFSESQIIYFVVIGFVLIQIIKFLFKKIF